MPSTARQLKDHCEILDAFENSTSKKAIFSLSYEAIKLSGFSASTIEAALHIKALHQMNQGNLAFSNANYSKTFYKDVNKVTMAFIQKLQYLLESPVIYVSQSTFSGNKRSTINAYSNSAIVLDVDYYNIPELSDLRPEQVYELMRLDGCFDFPEPAYAYATVRGLALVFAMETLPINYKKFKGNMLLRGLVVKALLKRFEKYGADSKA